MTNTFRHQVGLAALLALAGAGCGDDSGPAPEPVTGIRVTVITSGALVDPDGYLLSVVGSPTPIAANGSYEFQVDPGSYTLSLSGIASNCVPAMNPVPVTALEGIMAEVSFEVICHVLSGRLEVVVHTSSLFPDPDGYNVTISGGVLGPIVRQLASDDSVTLGVVPGSYLINIDDIAVNCTTPAADQVASVGPQAVARVSFDVTCQDPSAVGGLRILVTTSGTPDVTEYQLQVDGDPAVSIGLNDSLEVDVTQGAHLIELLGTTTICRPSGSSQRNVVVTAGLTTTVSFAVACVPTTGRIRFVGTTTGANTPGLLIGVIMQVGRLVDIVDLSPNGATLSHPHPPGVYSVGVAKPTTCTGGSQVTQATIVAGSVTDVRFAVNCP